MRRPRLNPRVSRVLDVMWWVAITATIISLILDGGSTLVMVSIVAVGAVAMWIFVPRPLEDHDTCAKCGHTMLDHHGNCQECLRSTVRGDSSAPAVPCSKFRRDEAARRTPWTRAMAWSRARS